MNYTYDGFVTEAKNAGLYEKFSDDDLMIAQKSPEYGMSLLGLMKDLGSATTDTQRLLANESIGKLRQSYGVTGTAGSAAAVTGAAGDRLVAPGTPGTLDGTSPTTYKAVLNDIVNQPAFSYDPAKDPTYAEYLRAYRQEGERASADALAKAAAMTGGRPSSFAINAAQQAQNYYASKAAEMIPTLRQNAYSEYLQDFENKRAIASILQGIASKGTTGTSAVDGTNGISWAERFAQGYVDRFDRPQVETENGSNGSGTTEENGETIVNPHTDDLVQIGDQKLTFEQLFAMVQSGEVIEVYDPVKKTYMYYFANQDAGKNKNPMYN